MRALDEFRDFVTDWWDAIWCGDLAERTIARGCFILLVTVVAVCMVGVLWLVQ